MKHILIILFAALSFAACQQGDSHSVARSNLENARYYHEAGNADYALLYYRLVRANIKNAVDSLSYWMPAVAGEGELLIGRKDLKRAKKDFTELAKFAARKRLPDEECLAWHRLGQIAMLQYDPILADSCYQRALVLEKGLKKPPLSSLKEEAVMARASVQVINQQVISDSTYRQLIAIQDTDRLTLRTLALKLLAIRATQLSGSQSEKNWLASYISAKDRLGQETLEKYAEQQESEKAQLILERDRETEARQLTLFISLSILALLVGIGIYLFISYQKKHEMDRIQKLLCQKEVEIVKLEQQGDELHSVRRMLVEKEQRMLLLERRSHELDTVRSLLEDKEQLLDELEQKYAELNQMHDDMILIRREVDLAEKKYRETSFYRKKIGMLMPTEKNPNKKLSNSDFDGIFKEVENQEELIEEMDTCFANFATGLLRTTPKLSREDVVYCCLFHLDIRPVDITAMMGVSRNAATMRRRRIEEKMQESK